LSSVFFHFFKFFCISPNKRYATFALGESIKIIDKYISNI